ncbi:MAG: response regulator [Planctomycetales bacterium]|nr:response regulator [Planctomycetales bacterium]
MVKKTIADHERLLGLFGIAAFVRDRDTDKYFPMGACPEWLRNTAADCRAANGGYDLGQVFFQLEHLLEDALEFWNGAPSETEKLDLGVWEIGGTSRFENEKFYVYAALFGDDQFLIFQALDASGQDPSRIFQRARESEVHFREEIAEKDRANRDLRIAKRVADDLHDTKSRILSTMTHEIRNPLTLVIGTLEYLDRATPDPCSRLQVAIDAANGLLTICNNVLDLSKFEAGRLALEFDEFDLRELLESLTAQCQVLTKDRPVDVECFVDHKIPGTVVGDRGRLQQVLTNLLCNAASFTESGQIHLASKLTSDFPNTRVRFTVRDTGCGIPEQLVPTIFDSFVQGARPDTRRRGGAGLGLTISNHLVNLMGGKIAVDTEEGLGTEFRFEIPFDAEGLHTLDKDCSSLPSVLVADENHTYRHIVQDLLKTNGFEVIAVSDGIAAIEQLSKHQYDLALLDTRLPGLSGVEVVKRHRSMCEKYVPTIAVSTSIDDSEASQWCLSGFDACLSKPYEIGQLLQLAQDLVESNRTAT